jgi:hypothetical protein
LVVPGATYRKRCYYGFIQDVSMRPLILHGFLPMKAKWLTQVLLKLHANAIAREENKHIKETGKAPGRVERKAP